MDRVLVRMPKELELFIAATAVLHNYVVQVREQYARRVRAEDTEIVVEFGHEEQFFFSCLFPRMEIIMAGEPLGLRRQEWNCVIDMRSTESARRLAEDTQKHLTFVWGIQAGSSPPIIPDIAYLGVRAHQDTVDILVDWNIGVQDAGQLAEFLALNFPELRVTVAAVAQMRAGVMFQKLAQSRMFIGKRSAATYLAAAMQKSIVELWPTDVPEWWLNKPYGKSYTQVCMKELSAIRVWPFVEEAIWSNISNTRPQDETLMGVPVSIAGNVAEK